MKTRNFIFSILALIFSANTLSAQEHKITVQNAKESTLILKDFYDELPIEGYAGNEIIITSADDRFENVPAQAKGLKPIYAAGTDNTGMALNVQQNGNEITVVCLLPIEKGGARYKIKVPENIALRIHSDCSRSNSVDIKNMKNEIEVNVCQSIKLNNVSGPLVLSTISGNIDIVFSDLSNNKPISIANISGEIDVTLPAKAAVNLSMKTISGNIYSDFDFTAGKKDMQQIGGSTIKSTLNGGGTDLKITNISGNIYLRKG